MRTRRLFTAIRIPEPLAVRIASRVRTALGEAGSFRTPLPDAFHLTLHFHGDVEVERTAVLADALGVALRDARGCALEFGETGAFPRRGAERVLWVGVRDAEGGLALERLRQAVLFGTEAAGLAAREEPSRPFQPHVSVARPRSRRGPKVEPAFYELDLRERFRVGEIALLESVPEVGRRSRYDTVRAFALA